jgi:hypothetical protein
LVRWLLYLLDPAFRRLADSKRRGGPDDALGVGENIVIVLKKERAK